MAELTFWDKLTFLPGFRFENTSNDYIGRTGKLSAQHLGSRGIISDSTGGSDYSEFLPMFHIKYNVMEGLDIRLAYTESISRPDYFNLVPFEQVNDAEKTLSRGNVDLKHTTAKNYDAYISWYNSVGLFSFGGFYKDLKNIDYLFEYTETEDGKYIGYYITEPVNSPKSKVYGFEFEAQTNFRFMPSPFDGILLSLNFTKIHSETEIPFFDVAYQTTFPYSAIVTKTFRQGRMPGQADEILNVTLGYEKGGFSGRVSMVYQGDMLQVVGRRAELDGFTDSSTRFDFSASQKVGKGISIYTNLNNFTNIPEKAYLGSRQNSTTEEYFGWTVDLGVKYSL